jgi:hypothetical protein
VRKKNFFVTDFSPDFVNRKALTRILTTGYLHTASKIGPTNRMQRVNVSLKNENPPLPIEYEMYNSQKLSETTSLRCNNPFENSVPKMYG